jgi:hypothetical protein
MLKTTLETLITELQDITKRRFALQEEEHRVLSTMAYLKEGKPAAKPMAAKPLEAIKPTEEALWLTDKELILDFASKHTCFGFTPSEALKYVNASKPGCILTTIGARLCGLVDDGMLVRVERGVYKLAAKDACKS